MSVLASQLTEGYIYGSLIPFYPDFRLNRKTGQLVENTGTFENARHINDGGFVHFFVARKDQQMVVFGAQDVESGVISVFGMKPDAKMVIGRVVTN